MNTPTDFHTVNHSLLLYRLEHLGVRGLAFNGFCSYLSERYLPRINKNRGTAWLNRIGPLLFLIFVNNLHNASKLLKFRISADESNTVASNISCDVLFHLMNKQLSYVKDWLAFNNPELILKKLTTLHIIIVSLP